MYFPFEELCHQHFCIGLFCPIYHSCENVDWSNRKTCKIIFIDLPLSNILNYLSKQGQSNGVIMIIKARMEAALLSNTEDFSSFISEANRFVSLLELISRNLTIYFSKCLFVTLFPDRVASWPGHKFEAQTIIGKHIGHRIGLKKEWQTLLQIENDEVENGEGPDLNKNLGEIADFLRGKVWK